ISDIGYSSRPGDATAINAVAGEDLGAALIVDYLTQQKNIPTEILTAPCTQGTRKGVRLDRWIHTMEGKKNIYYQTEIKNWSAHAIGGKKLSVTASAKEISDHKKERWKNIWADSTFKNPQKSTARKVLQPMKLPEGYNGELRPLICFWDAMHPRGRDEPFFSVPVNDPNYPNFKKLWVFSMSAYLRNQRTDKRIIRLSLERTEKRIELLKEMFVTP
ncbi:MAG: hypothetical protein LBE50_02155, partial [Gallionellaceae bacterium]|nr:hypothetical protein [Gallionellaceae bacterium]